MVKFCKRTIIGGLFMENEKREYKESWKDEYLKTIAAFANSYGGELIIGVNDKGELVGVSDCKKLLEDIPNKIRHKLLITCSVIQKIENNKCIIIIMVEPSEFPVFYEGKIYIRSGSTTQEITGAELNSFLLTKTGKSWDSIETMASFDEIDNETIKLFVQLSKPRLPFIESTDPKTILKNLGLIEGNKLTRAALLLFGKNPQTYFISAYIRGGRFKGTTNVVDSKEFSGNLFNQINDALDFIKKHINVKFDINVKDLTLEKLSRKDIWDYPLDAIREAIINAVIHRDYNDNSWVEIRIYDDKIWINNPGKLLSPLTVEDLKMPYHQTKTRNPLLAKVFYYAGLIEQWGTGTTKMIDLCRTSNLPEPEFLNRQEGIGSFTVIFYKDIYTPENMKKMGLNERQIKAILYLKENGKITNKEYRMINNISDEGARLDLLDLVKKDILKQEGKGKNTYYTLK